jgi:CTP synthase (UTP-ammonia lyase)
LRQASKTRGRQPEALGRSGAKSSTRKNQVHIAMVGKYVDLGDSYKSLNGRCATLA